MSSYVVFSFAFLSTSYKQKQTMHEYWSFLFDWPFYLSVQWETHSYLTGLSNSLDAGEAKHAWFISRLSWLFLILLFSFEFKDKLVKFHEKLCWYCNYNYIDSEFNLAGLTDRDVKFLILICDYSLIYLGLAFMFFEHISYPLNGFPANIF